jgi:hypothetical protein
MPVTCRMKMVTMKTLPAANPPMSWITGGRITSTARFGTTDHKIR